VPAACDMRSSTLWAELDCSGPTCVCVLVRVAGWWAVVGCTRSGEIQPGPGWRVTLVRQVLQPFRPTASRLCLTTRPMTTRATRYKRRGCSLIIFHRSTDNHPTTQLYHHQPSR
jgi:hypothetical protein